MVVEAGLSREEKAYDNGHNIEGKSLEAEELAGKDESGYRAVGNAAEKRDHTHCRAECGRKAEERCHSGAEGGSRKESGNDLASLKACTNGEGGEEYLQSKGLVANGLPVKKSFNNIDASAVVVRGADGKGENNDDGGNDGYAKDIVFKKLFCSLCKKVHCRAEDKCNDAAKSCNKQSLPEGIEGIGGKLADTVPLGLYEKREGNEICRGA